MIDRAGLAAFLRRRRAALQPEDVGLARGRRRRIAGLRREEVAALCRLSADYYSRLEQGRGPFPSERLIASIAQGMHLSSTNATTSSASPGTARPPRTPPVTTSAPACSASSTGSPTAPLRSSTNSARRCDRRRWASR
ncbi:helix-turn-helix domain-containing protein [Phytohabitans flavus]|uniref:helix-turn-helix domain-containing protein n=1 Tax=Phytohabitans flavus TaxID=1076124 RepID=UPI003632FDBC